MLKSSHHRFREVGRVSRRRNPTASPFNAFLSDYAALIRPTNATNASTSGQARGMPNAPSPLLTLRLRFLRQASFDKLPSTSFLRQASFDKLPSTSSGQAGQAGQAKEGKKKSPSPRPSPPHPSLSHQGRGFYGGSSRQTIQELLRRLHALQQLIGQILRSPQWIH